MLRIMQRIISVINRNTIARHSLELLVTQGAASVITLLNTYLQIKGIGVAGVGIFSAIVAYSTFFDGLVNFQSYNAVIKYGSQAQQSKNVEQLMNYYKVAIVQDAVTAVIAFTLGHAFLSFAARMLSWNSEILLYARVYLLTILFNINGSTNAAIRLNDKFAVTGIISIITNAIKCILLICALFFAWGIKYYVYIEMIRILLLNVLTFVLSYRYTKKHWGVGPYSFPLKFDKEFTRFNIYSNLVSTVDIPTGQLVNLIINKYLGFEAVGIYAILTKIGSIVTKITSPISQSMLPELSSLVADRKQEKAWNIGKKMFAYVNMAGIGCLAFAMLTINIWMPLFMDVTLHNAICFALYALYLIFTSAAVGVHAYFISNSYVKANLWISIISDILYLAMLFWSIQIMGLIGVILSLIVQACMVVVAKLLYRRKAENSMEASEW